MKPTEINLHKVSRVLELTFEDGANFKLPVEYLRVYSPSAEVQGHGPGQEVLQIGKEDVNIDSIEPMGPPSMTIMIAGFSAGIISTNSA
jgi:DUF971 family protein